MSVTVLPPPDMTDKRLAFVLAEDRIGHYPEFRAFFTQVFALDRLGLTAPGYVLAPSGLAYALVFIGRSGETFPSGMEIYAVMDALEPIEETVLDVDLWAILQWMIEGVGGEWTLEDLESTGRLYRIRVGEGYPPVRPNVSTTRAADLRSEKIGDP